MEILKRENYQHKQLQSSKSGEAYSLSALLTSAQDSDDLFIHHEILEPGRRSSAPHRHVLTDEFIYVLKGSPTAIEGEIVHQLMPGDCATFSKNSEALHVLENRTDENVEVLAISQRRKIQDVQFEKSTSGA